MRARTADTLREKLRLDATNVLRLLVPPPASRYQG